MILGTCILIITLNEDELNAPTKRRRLSGWIKNKTCVYAAYKRPTSELGKPAVWVVLCRAQEFYSRG